MHKLTCWMKASLGFSPKRTRHVLVTGSRQTLPYCSLLTRHSIALFLLYWLLAVVTTGGQTPNLHDLLSDPELLAAFQVGWFCSPFIPWLKILHLLIISQSHTFKACFENVLVQHRAIFPSWLQCYFSYNYWIYNYWYSREKLWCWVESLDFCVRQQLTWFFYGQNTDKNSNRLTIILQKKFNVLKWYYDENRTFPIQAILKHKQVDFMSRKMPFTVFKYLFSFQRYSSF